MREQLYQLLETSMSGVSIDDIAIRIAVSVILGLAIFASYWLSHVGTIYSQKFNINLITLTVLTATVMTVIGNNLALSLGMVGALSIVRFRTAIKDARDTTYIFWAIICGICCGAGQFMAAAIGSAAVFVILLILGRVRNDTRVLLVIRAARSQELVVEGLVFEYFQGRAEQRVKNTTEESSELMYELSRGTLAKAQKCNENSVTDDLYALGGIEYVNIVTQNDELGS